MDPSDGGGGAESWQLRAWLPVKFLALLVLFPNPHTPREEPDPAQGTLDSCSHGRGDALALLSASLEPPQPCSLQHRAGGGGVWISLALGLKEDLNWAEMLQAADAGRELWAGKRSCAGRKERARSCCCSFSLYFS